MLNKTLFSPAADGPEAESENGAERGEEHGVGIGDDPEAEVEVDGPDPPVLARTRKQKTGIGIHCYNCCPSNKAQ